MQQLQLVSFALAMTALVVCGWVFTRKPRKKLPTETLRHSVSGQTPAVTQVFSAWGLNILP